MTKTNPSGKCPSIASMAVLSRLLLPSRDGHTPLYSRAEEPSAKELESRISEIGRDEFEDLVALAHSNHVIVRSMQVFRARMRNERDEVRAEWAEDALSAELARIGKAVPFLHAICAELEENGYDATVIKSLDHWPDLGSDLDLYTSAKPREVCQFMKKRFDAQIASRSWGDRLASKWNFLIPGLTEAIEIHMGRLGQTGEQVAIASWVPARAEPVTFGDHTFRVPAASDRLMISTLQRMYRHFYFRLCDIVDTVALSDADAIDYDDLLSSAKAAGIWEGVATYLLIVSDYLKQYRGRGLDLPRFVTAAARFGGEEIYIGQGFLRVPIMPQSVVLYGSQLTGLLRKRELYSSVRLGLLPWLATAAVVGQKITGSDKGIW